MSLPTNEPLALRAGDTWVWRREDLTDYPAGTWTITYYFRAPTANFQITAAAFGTAHAVNVAKGTTAAYTPARYKWIACADNGTVRVTVDQGELLVQPNLAVAGNLDDRSHARKMLEAIEALLEGRATKDQQAFTHGDVAITRIPIEQLKRIRDEYRAEVRAARRRERLRNGQGVSSILPVRFT